MILPFLKTGKDSSDCCKHTWWREPQQMYFHVNLLCCCAVSHTDIVNEAEVFMGPGLGLVAQIMFSYGPGSRDSSLRLYRTFHTFLGHSLFAKRSYSLSHSSYACDTVGHRKQMPLTFSGIFS
jgi:hypothetical protein